MAQIGSFNQLSVIDLITHGAILDGGEKGEILLPNRYVPENCQIGDSIDAFIYADSQDRLVATTQRPKAQSGEFASLKVVQTNKIGAFLDWGLPKDLLVPFNNQQRPMEVGKFYLVRVLTDERTERIVASTKLDKFLDIWPADYEQGEQVDLIIAGKTDLGFKAIINHQHWGLIFQSDIFKPLRTGQRLKGYIKQVREDGRVDLVLSRAGKGKVIDFKEQLLAYLEDNNGYCDIHDKSSPALIQKTFGVSKKAFKATVGHLLKLEKITLEPNGIRLKQP
ncbi:GntR family transcriptional regulator [Thalassotalea loyana]|uniref:GntR family transcriptional regulator n=1 Tax=Thalassotalea loyana TaxID=280483 RepID=A0ABQ6HJB9_9GAMM|nr:S1-like domain-containing RNA-binding protein [Thalassotalea loyana]GLX87100.1 GntR family transcriptional regulator [Thalassotalea loyana]